MDCPDLPDWLSLCAFEDIVVRPSLGPELRNTLTRLQAGIWHSPMRAMCGESPGLGLSVRVAAQTFALRTGQVLTVVLMGVPAGMTAGQQKLTSLIGAYAAGFSDAKWARTRWFLAEADGSLAELKLQAHPDRRIWFLQEFDVR